MADKSYSESIFEFDNSKNGEENREPIANMLDAINNKGGDLEGESVAYGLVTGDGEEDFITYKNLMTPVQVKTVFDTGKIILNKNNKDTEVYVYITSIDNTITENAKKRAISNKAFVTQLNLIHSILNAIITSKKL